MMTMITVGIQQSLICRLLLVLSLFLLAVPIVTSENENTNPGKPDLFRASTWTPLDAIQRADLYLAAAEAGKLGEHLHQLIPLARLIEPGEFPCGNQLVRGAKATASIPPSILCTIGERASISVPSIVHMLRREHTNLSHELDAIGSLVSSPADERSLLALLILREASRPSSPVMPYVLTFLRGAHEHIPSSWDPASPAGADRRASLAGLDNGPALLHAADELRKHIVENYLHFVPQALERLPQLLGVTTGPDDDIDVAKELYSMQRFIEVWLAIRSRSFQNGAHGVLVPLACLMNHPAEGEKANVEIGVGADHGLVVRAVRNIEIGEQLTYSYGNLTAERALLVYGFPMSVWSRLPSGKGF